MSWLQLSSLVVSVPMITSVFVLGWQDRNPICSSAFFPIHLKVWYYVDMFRWDLDLIKCRSGFVTSVTAWVHTVIKAKRGHIKKFWNKCRILHIYIKDIVVNILHKSFVKLKQNANRSALSLAMLSIARLMCNLKLWTKKQIMETWILKKNLKSHKKKFTFGWGGVLIKIWWSNISTWNGSTFLHLSHEMTEQMEMLPYS